ncbi:MAG: excinuclease ABC subunit UvrA [Myxococcota bacterium]|nr:excinuclease ABC subunit UvrA [Myxococcota bacterium]
MQKRRGTVKTNPKIGDERFDPIREIRVRGAKEHNLKNVDVDIPRDRLVVITGLSGSGKSSLAFDTIFAEGQRKYMESLSAYARQFLDQQKKPDIESIEGLPPTIAIEQRNTGHTPRSTVATTTEINDYLRLLFARIGKPRCWFPIKQTKQKRAKERCNQIISGAEPSQITDTVVDWEMGTKLLVLAPIIRDRKGHHKEVAENLLKEGFIRARVNGEIIQLDQALVGSGENPLNLGRYEKHSIEAVVDRLVAKPGIEQRLSDSIQIALKLGNGVVIITRQDLNEAWTNDTLFSEHFSCALHPDIALEELEPRLFSFNAHQGACPRCQGLGTLLEFDEELVLEDQEKPVGKGGIAPWKRNGPGGLFSRPFVRRFCSIYGIDRMEPVSNFDAELKEALLYGEDDTGWEGVLPLLQKWFENTDSDWAKEFLHQFMSEHHCELCDGDRLNIQAQSVFVEVAKELPAEILKARLNHGLSQDSCLLNISDFSRLNIKIALEVIQSMKLTQESEKIARPIVREVKARLEFLASVGLEYLTLDRRTNSLSGGEAQRIRLATQVGSGIVGAAYILDEPTIGLHSRDNDRLIKTLRHLADIGNSVLIVEHDEEVILAADHVIDIGPGPGVHGGEIVAQGNIADICEAPNSETGKYLSGKKSIHAPKPSERRKLTTRKALTVHGAKENNLKSIKAQFPLGGLICVTGVSGSGKSTLVNDILLKSVRKNLHQSKVKPGFHQKVTGLQYISRIIEVDQSPIGRTPRSNPATYTNMFDPIRKLFTMTSESRQRGYQPGRFSFNVKGGRCEACQGQGVKKIEMHFLPDVFVECEICRGARYNRETLEIKYRDSTIADVLNMTVEDACNFFDAHPKVKQMANCLHAVGLDYITLGQPSTTLSGGEAQRVKLASELGKGDPLRRKESDHTLYILDEPTTGLHFADVHKLIDVMNRLVDQGNTMVVIEHNLDVIKNADWVIDLGPEGGDKGGEIVACGTPEEVAETKGSFTATYLRELL